MNIGVKFEHWEQIKTVLRRSDPYTSRKYGFGYGPPVTSIWDHVSYKLPKLSRAVRLFMREPIGALKQVITSRCWNCYSLDIRVHHQQGQTICVSCGYVLDSCSVTSSTFQQSVGMQPFAMHYASNLPRKLSSNVNKRLNHFKFWVNRLQGKENFRVSNDELELIRLELDKYPYCPITPEKIKLVLRRLRLSRYYSNIYSLLKEFTGEALVSLEPRHEECLIQFFLQIQDCFYQVAGTRANMVSYPYLIKKMAELLGWREMAQAIPLLKSRLKTRDLDVIWKRICDYHSLTFIRSI